MVELWVVRVASFIGWILVGWFAYDKFKSKKIYGDLVCRKEKWEGGEWLIYMAAELPPEELVKHKYVVMRVLYNPRE